MYKLMQFVSVSSLISFTAYTDFNIDATGKREGRGKMLVNIAKDSICRLNSITHSQANVCGKFEASSEMSRFMKINLPFHFPFLSHDTSYMHDRIRFRL